MYTQYIYTGTTTYTKTRLAAILVLVSVRATNTTKYLYKI